MKDLQNEEYLFSVNSWNYTFYSLLKSFVHSFLRRETVQYFVNPVWIHDSF